MSDDEAGPGTHGSGSTSEELPDGAEAPPPGVKTMATVRWALVALMALVAAGAWLHWARTTGHAHVSSSAVQYRCPMHPAVLQDRPGSCPICGMDLVPASAARPADAASTPAASYTCPMHPEVTSDDPKARCPKCGMFLVAAAPKAAPAGLAPVTIGPERAQLIGVRTATVLRQRITPQLRTVGFISANEGMIALVSSRVIGWIEDLHVAQSGQRVKKGEALATVYSPDLLAAETAYLNTVRWAERQASGGQAATSSGADSDARRRLELYGMARQDIAEITKAGKPMNAVPIRSPVDGFVARKSALAGLYVQSGTELFQIVDLSTVWVVADVYEHEMTSVQVGQTARLSLGAYPSETFNGRVHFIYPAVNPETRTLQARMEFKNPGLKLRPGMYADVVIEGSAAERLAVPTEALVETGESQYVFVAREQGRFEPRKVRTGLRRDDRVEVLEGLAAGERVVTTANFLVDSESRLQAAVQQFKAGQP